MTPEKFHDALTLLPADLVAEADRRRQRKPKVIPWRPYAAAAACLCLLLLGGWITFFPAAPEMKAAAPEAAMLQGSSNAAYDAAVPEAPAEAEEAAPAEGENGALRTESVTEDAASATAATQLYPGITLTGALPAAPSGAACYSSKPEPVLFTSSAQLEAYRERSIRFQQPELSAACGAWDESWFENQDLVLVTVCGIPEGVVPQLTQIRHHEGQWKFVIQADTAPSEEALRDWHFLLSAKKGLIHPEETLVCSTALSADTLSYQQSFTPRLSSETPCGNIPEELLVTSRSQLDQYFADHANSFDFSHMKDMCGDYDDAWFEAHDLLLIRIDASHPDNRWQIVDITTGSRWDWEVLVQVSGESYPDQEAYALHLLVELEKGILLPENSIIRITTVPPGE